MPPTFALVGNPNVGKTAVFNALTGLSQTTGNYPGVTVDRKCGRLQLEGVHAEIVDLPGSYSLAARSPDEIIVTDVLLDQQRGEASIDGLVVILDASNLERNLYFLSQLIELDKPLIVALNMMDIAERRGVQIDVDAMSNALGVPVVPIVAHKGKGIRELKQAIRRMAAHELTPTTVHCDFPEAHGRAVALLDEELAAREPALGRRVPRLELFRILVDEEGYAEQRLVRKLGGDFERRLGELRLEANNNGSSLAAQEARVRYAWVRHLMDQCVTRPSERKHSRSERIDNILTHKVYGTVFFLALMMLVFQFLFTWAGPLMDLIDLGVTTVSDAAAGILPEGPLQSLIVDGIIAGVGGVIIFLPQIMILSLFIALLEDCGYMSRAAFLMDRLLGWCGLSGQSFIPMLSSFACAIPGIMATRTIHDRRDRFTTILVAPLMSCSARLPVYTIMIAAFVPHAFVLGNTVSVQGVTLFVMYMLGVVVAVPIAWTLKKTLFKGHKPPFILEMPSYKTPQFTAVLRKVLREAKEFTIRAGTLILAVTIVVWALAYFPRSDAVLAAHEAAQQELIAATAPGPEQEEALVALEGQQNGQLLRQSYLGRFGRTLEPVFTPLGWDWRIGTAALASFPAREVVVAVLSTLFNMSEAQSEEPELLHETLRGATWPDGEPLFTLAVALSIMVFFALCCQCGATLAVIKRETKQWRWPLLTFSYMTVLAYLGAFATYQIASALGLGA